jgi:hypothetical protein
MKIYIFIVFFMSSLVPLISALQMSSRLRLTSTIRFHSRPSRRGMTVSASVDAAQSEKKVKRKFALMFGYMGQHYYGLQADNLLEGTNPTVEAAIEAALYSAGLIAERNHNNLSKIDWSRASRTDKGVSSVRLVITAKLEVV